MPIQGTKAELFRTVNFLASAGYTHTFTKAVVATNPDLQRIRLDPNGQSIPSDQLSGAALARHMASFGVGTGLSITEKITWKNTFNWTPVWKYGFREDVEICNVVVTGCVTPERVEEPQDFSVITLFSSAISVNVMKEMDVAVSYSNLTLQLGPDGQRRNIFYSPEARLSLGITANLDEIYKSIKGRPNTTTSGADTARR